MKFFRVFIIVLLLLFITGFSFIFEKYMKENIDLNKKYKDLKLSVEKKMKEKELFLEKEKELEEIKKKNVDKINKYEEVEKWNQEVKKHLD